MTLLRRTLKASLDKRGFETRTAASVAAAKPLLDGVDWIVLDLMMPNEDGTVLLEHVRRTKHPAKVAVMTGAVNEAADRRAREGVAPRGVHAQAARVRATPRILDVITDLRVSCPRPTSCNRCAGCGQDLR